jgi:hypothetical protein
MALTCPICGVQLTCESDALASPHTCPSCQKTVAVRPQQAPGQLFALDEGIAPDKPFNRTVADKSEAESQLSEWSREMPAVQSSYTPSGKLPGRALGFLVVGSLAGSVAGLIGGAIVAPVGGVIGALGWLFCYLTRRTRQKADLWYVVVFVGLAAWVVACSLLSAACTTLFGDWAKNRNVLAAVALSFLSSSLALVLAGLVYFWVVKPILTQHGWDNDLFVYGGAILGAIGPFLAASIAAQHVLDAKFCEDCERYMHAAPLKNLCLGGMQAMVRALAKGRLDVAVSLLHTPEGHDGKVELFTCPSCSRSYLEITAVFKAMWTDWKMSPKEKAKSWLAASRELTAAETASLREAWPNSSRVG